MTMRQLGRWLVRGLFGLLAGALLLVGVLLAKMALTPSRQPPPSAQPPAAPIAPGEAPQIAERLGQAIRIPTVSREGQASSPEALLALHGHLQIAFPSLHAALRREVVSGYSLFYTWPGTDPASRSYLLLAHQDVVPVEAAAESRWHHPPFSGAIADGFIWGRGALDDKASLMAIMEAIERLLRQGYRPRRTVYLAFGHDEELSGQQGAATIAKLLTQRGIRPEFALDEGQAVVHGILPGLSRPIGLIGLAEKGYLSAELVVNMPGGHSSIPPAHTAVGILSRAITRLEDQPMPPSLAGVTGKLFAALGPEMELPLRLVMSNLWLLEPVLRYQLSRSATTNAVIRTTTAATMFEGSPKDNVLPQRARAVVNFRLMPGDSSESVLRHVRDVVADPRVEVHALPGMVHEPTPESRDTAPAYGLLAGTIRQIFPDTLVAPALNLGAADARHYVGVADDVYRFQPMPLGPDDLPRLHGTDERIAVSDYLRSVVFYEQLIQNADKAP